MSKSTFTTTYPDRQILIDGDQTTLKLVKNESAQYQTKNVIDICSGKNLTDSSRQGTIVLTNLRLIYTLDLDPQINVQIGFNCVNKILVGNIETSKQKQLIQQDRTLVVHTTSAGNAFRFEFLPRGSKTIFELFQSLYRAYDTSKLYRKLRIRQAVVQNNLLFSDEFAENSIKDCVALSPLSPTAVTGVLMVTNFRVFWHAQNSIQFNISAPYLDITGLQVKKQVFAKGEEAVDCLLVSVSHDEKPLVMAVKCGTKSPEELYQLINARCVESAENPLFGIKIETGKIDETDGMFQGVESQNVQMNQKIVQIVKGVDRVSEYLQSCGDAVGEVVYDEELGVCFEEIKGMTREELWAL